MQLGISSYTFPWAVGEQQDEAARFVMANHLLKYAHDNGIAFVQFGDNLPLHEFSETEINALAVTAGQMHVNIQVGTRKLTTGNIRRYIPIAKKLSSPFIRMVIDDSDYHPPVKDVIVVINECLPDLKKEGIVLAIENHDRFSAVILEEIILKTDKEFVGICLDTANSIGAGEGIEYVVKILAPYTVNLHVKDFTISRLHHKMGFKVEGRSAGDGMLDIKWLLRETGSYQRCETATVEIWSGEEETMTGTIEREKQWVEKSIRYLKNIIA